MLCDVSRWPLVVCVVDAPMDLDAYRAELAAWSDWLARREPFALLRVYDNLPALAHPEGSAPLAKDWMQQTVPLLKGALLGMATVVPELAYAPLRKVQMHKLLGVPAEAFLDRPSALAWLQALPWPQPVVDWSALQDLAG